jgi:uncharacterized protein (DUF4415 family)
MNKNPEFPFANARRITPEEISQAKTAIKKQFGEEYTIRNSNPDYELVSLKLDAKIVSWAKQEAEKRGVNYQVIINNELLKLCS